jgi:hypothetical protein
MTGEYVLLDKADTVQPSTSGGESEPSEPSEEEDKSSPEKPLDSSEDSLALDKVFGFVDYDEVSVSLDGLFFLSFKMTILIIFFFLAGSLLLPIIHRSALPCYCYQLGKKLLETSTKRKDNFFPSVCFSLLFPGSLFKGSTRRLE